MESRSAEKYAGWYASWMEDDQGKALIECMQKRIQSDEQLLDNILAEIELCSDPMEKSPEVILRSIKDMISCRRSVSAKRGFFEWTYNAHPDRTADQGCSVEGLVEICETCEGTGWYGDNGPGILGNSEFHECDCCDHSKVEKCSCGWHKYLVVGGVAWCEECNREADLSVCRLFHPPFNIVLSDTLQNLPTENNTERKPDANQ